MFELINFAAFFTRETNVGLMEDEELMNLVLEKLYHKRFDKGLLSVRNALAEMDIYLRNNQMNRIMADIKSNGFALVSKIDDDYQAAISPEGSLYCEENLMIK
ncbi:MAG: hypothetical protein ACPGLV_08855 [Bacteroidia bacterium]